MLNSFHLVNAIVAVFCNDFQPKPCVGAGDHLQTSLESAVDHLQRGHMSQGRDRGLSGETMTNKEG